MRVWVLYDYGNDDFEILGVFDNFISAEKRYDELVAKDADLYMCIKDFEVQK